MRRMIVHVVVLTGLVLLSLGVSMPTARAAAISPGCERWNSGGLWLGGGSSGGQEISRTYTGDFAKGEIAAFHMSFNTGVVLDFRLETPEGNPVTAITTSTSPLNVRHTIPSTGSYTFKIAFSFDAFYSFSLTTSCAAPGDPAAPTNTSPPQPGCDVLMSIPDTAVGGKFVTPALAYWAPDKPTSPPITLPAGASAWVLGTDEDGAYTKIAWGCTLLWVRIETMGPNYDPPWSGWPLPTAPVE